MPRPLYSALFVLLYVASLILTFSRVSASVTISSLTAERLSGQVVVKWSTATELNNIGFNVYRSTTAGQRRDTKVNASLIPSQCLGCITGANYSLNDPGVGAAQTYYTLESVDTSNGTQLYGPAAASANATPTQTPTRTPTVPNVTSTPTRTSIPSAVPTTSTPTRSSTGVATLTVAPSATSGLSSLKSSTPARTKVAMVPSGSTPTASNPMAGPQVVSIPQTPVDVQSISDPAMTDDSSQAPGAEEILDNASAETAAQESMLRLTIMGSLGLSACLGLASLVCAMSAFILLVRASRTR